MDLEGTTGITPYPFVSEWEAYCPTPRRGDRFSGGGLTATIHRLRPAGRCPQGRPWPHQPHTLLAAIEELNACVRGLTAALIGDTDEVPHEPLHRPPAVDFDSEAAAAAEAEAIEAATEH